VWGGEPIPRRFHARLDRAAELTREQVPEMATEIARDLETGLGFGRFGDISWRRE
jgi:hypothetical protein